MIGFFFHLLWFSGDSSKLLYISSVISFLFMGSIPWCECTTLFRHSLIDRLLGYFQFRTSMNKASITIQVQCVVRNNQATLWGWGGGGSLNLGLCSSSHASSPFCPGCFASLTFCPGQSVWTLIFLFYTSRHHWNDRWVPQCPVFFHWDGVS